MKEAQVKEEVLNKLSSLLHGGEVIWFRVLHNGLFFDRNGRRITMGQSIFPMGEIDFPTDLDIIVLINCGDGTIATLFLDVKRASVKKFSLRQEEFKKTMQGKPKILCRIINDVSQLGSIIKECKSL